MALFKKKKSPRTPATELKVQAPAQGPTPPVDPLEQALDTLSRYGITLRPGIDPYALPVGTPILSSLLQLIDAEQNSPFTSLSLVPVDFQLGDLARAALTFNPSRPPLTLQIMPAPGDRLRGVYSLRLGDTITDKRFDFHSPSSRDASALDLLNALAPHGTVPVLLMPTPTYMRPLTFLPPAAAQELQALIASEQHPVA